MPEPWYRKEMDTTKLGSVLVAGGLLGITGFAMGMLNGYLNYSNALYELDENLRVGSTGIVLLVVGSYLRKRRR